MDFSRLFIVKHNSKIFEPKTIVYGEICGWCGNLYKIQDLNDSSKHDLLLYYDLYPFKLDYRFYYRSEWQEIVNTFIEKNKN